MVRLNFKEYPVIINTIYLLEIQTKEDLPVSAKNSAKISLTVAQAL